MSFNTLNNIQWLIVMHVISWFTKPWFDCNFEPCNETIYSIRPTVTTFMEKHIELIIATIKIL